MYNRFLLLMACITAFLFLCGLHQVGVELVTNVDIVTLDLQIPPRGGCFRSIWFYFSLRFTLIDFIDLCVASF